MNRLDKRIEKLSKATERNKRRNCGWTVQIMNGREVAMRHTKSTDEPNQCSDCGRNAKLHIIELWKDDRCPSGSKWYWCGGCDIGG